MRPPASPERCAAIVGAGPAGLYLLAALLKSEVFDRVDIYESALAPYGLVRYGVAPDHPKTRRITTVLARGMDSPVVRYHGNVEVGRDVELSELRRCYDVVAIATGMRGDRRLGIPGEDLPGSIGASELVAWYTGHPDATPVGPLDQVRAAAVIGAGNVALDVARILTRSEEALRRTSMPRHVVDVLAASGLTDVHLFARRGPAFAKFTSPEFHEIGDLEDVDIVVDPRDLVVDDADREAMTEKRIARIVVDLLHEWSQRPSKNAGRRIHLHFWQRPQRILGSSAVTGIEVAPTRAGAPELPPFDVDLVVRSIGYHGTAVPGLPFDASRGVVPSADGRVSSSDAAGDEVISGVYVTGWLRRGPSGVIGTNRPDAAEVAASIVADLDALPRRAGGPDEVLDRLVRAGRRVLSWADWLRIEHHEAELGAAHGADPIVLHDVDDALRVLDEVRQS